MIPSPSTWLSRSGRVLADRGVLLAGLAVIGLLLGWTRALSHVDDRIYDAFLGTRPHVASDDIAIVAVDARSLEALGRWPWPRTVHANLVRRLSAVGATAVGLDVAFSEPGLPEEDAALVQAVAESRRVVLPVLPDRSDIGGAVRETPPLPALAEAAASLGHADLELDEDTVSRRVYLRAGVDVPRWPAFAAAVLGVASPGALAVWPGERRPGVATTPGRWVRDFGVLVSFAGAPGRYRQWSYVDVLRDDAVARQLAGKIVLVGATASGLGPRVVTPVSHRSLAMTSVEFDANALDSLRQGKTVVPAHRSLEIALCLLAIVVPVLLYPRGNATRNVLWLVGLVLAALLLSYAALAAADLWLPPGLPLVLLLLGYPIWLWRRLEWTAHGLAVAREHSRAALQSVTDAVISVDERQRITHLNPAAELMLGIGAEEAVGRELATVLVGATETDRAQLLGVMADCRRTLSTQHLTETIDIKGRKQHGTVHLAVSPLVGDGAPTGAMVLALSDAREDVALTERAAYLATYDPMTALPNAYLLADRLECALADARREGRTLAVLWIGVVADRTQIEAIGPPLGDIVSEEIARRLHGTRRRSDTVARITPDVFVVLLRGGHHADRVAVVATDLMHRLGEPVRIGNREVTLSARIGAAMFPDDGREADVLLANAEVAMNRVQAGQASRFCFYSADLDMRARRFIDARTRLALALQGGEFELLYQPQVSLETGALAGVEALLRWRHPHRGVLVPPQFIPDVIDSDLPERLDDWVLRMVCAQARLWREAGLDRITIGVNVTAQRFARDEFAPALRRTVVDSGIDPSAIVVELPEEVLLSGERGHAYRVVSMLRDTGMHVAINDFGAGQASLSSLKRLPIDHIKLSEPVIRSCMSDLRESTLMRAAVSAARGVGMAVTAVGLETRMQLELLRQFDCSRAQGFHFGAPMAPDALFRRAVTGRSKWLASELVALRSSGSTP